MAIKKPIRTSYQCKIDKEKRNRHTRQFKVNQAIGKLLPTDRTFMSVLKPTYSAFRSVRFYFKSSPMLELNKQTINQDICQGIINNPEFIYAVLHLFVNNQHRIMFYRKGKDKTWQLFQIEPKLDRVSYICEHGKGKVTGSVLLDNERVNCIQICQNYWQLGIKNPFDSDKIDSNKTLAAQLEKRAGDLLLKAESLKANS